MDMLKYEQKYWNNGCMYVGGIDEAGRGPLAGPVVASCVIFKKDTVIPEIKDLTFKMIQIIIILDIIFIRFI